MTAAAIPVSTLPMPARRALAGPARLAFHYCARVRFGDRPPVWVGTFDLPGVADWTEARRAAAERAPADVAAFLAAHFPPLAQAPTIERAALGRMAFEAMEPP
jgi:hypothetical protein